MTPTDTTIVVISNGLFDSLVEAFAASTGEKEGRRKKKKERDEMRDKLIHVGLDDFSHLLFPALKRHRD